MSKELAASRTKAQAEATARDEAEKRIAAKDKEIQTLQQQLSDRTEKMNVKMEDYNVKLRQKAADYEVLETVLTQLKAEMERKDGEL